MRSSPRASYFKIPGSERDFGLNIADADIGLSALRSDTSNDPEWRRWRKVAGPARTLGGT